MYEPLWLVSDKYPGVVPNVRTQGFMALTIAVSILWALVWYEFWTVIDMLMVAG